MKILLCNPRGFCAGVNMAIECVERVLKLKGPPIYVYHEIVHNRHVVRRFTEQGVVFVNSIDEVPRGATVVYSAHGVSPEVRRQADQRGLVQVDATCPLVAKVHSEAARYARQHFAIVLVGHRNHDEVVGTYGEAPDSIHIVESVQDVDALEIPVHHRMAYLTQTTLSLDEAEAIIAALRRRFPGIRAPQTEDICYATTNRQLAVKQLAGSCDVVLVVGSQNSSNSQRLVEVARQRGVPAYLLDDASCLDPDWVQDAQSVLITAGASAPEHLVVELVDYLKTRYDAEVEPVHLAAEEMYFEQPLSLRRIELASR
jgi:4-hydroxy-3-methylbut-2-en-1-yl diphosphate reductase